MKQFFTILKFELDNYFKSKSYVISTILIAVLAAGIMFVPRVKDAITGDKKDSTVQDSTSKEDSSADADAEHTYGVYDPDGILIIDVDGSVWGSMETGINLVSFDSEDALKKAVEDEKAAAGFAVRSLSDYDYYVYNKSMDNSDAAVFDSYLGMLVKLDYCEKHDLDLNEFMEASYKEITHDEYVLGKDSTQNFWYCYVLVILIFMLIIMYGMSIASSVTNEKSNRSIEILVTSTDSTALLPWQRYFRSESLLSVCLVRTSTIKISGALTLACSWISQPMYWLYLPYLELADSCSMRFCTVRLVLWYRRLRT